MDNKLYVGNLSYNLTVDALRDLFKEFGEIVDCVIITDKYTNRSKGFGFVTFKEKAQADAAISAMHDKEIDGRKLVVNVARPKKEFNDRKRY